MSAYLDTQVAVWLGTANLKRVSLAAREQMAKTDLLLSPVVLLEFEYLFEIKRTVIRAEDVLLKLEFELGLKVCKLDFSLIVGTAIYEKWTRDPFDRLIVAHAKANGFSPLISADLDIRQNYPRAVW